MNEEQGSPNPTQNPLPPKPQQIAVTLRLRARKPGVVYALIAISILMYAGQYISEMVFGYDLPAALGAKVNEGILAGQYWRLFTPMVLHASILHIAVNMYALYNLGRGLETHYGHWRFLALYIVTGFCGNVLSYFMSPNPSLGASTAIFGLAAAEAVFIYKNRILFGVKTRAMLVNLVTVIGANLILGLSPRIDNWGHLGGLLGGLAFAWLAGPLLQVHQTSEGLFLEDSTQTHQVISATLGVMLIFLILVFYRLFST